MRTSQLFFPTLKESPADAEIISHQLMLRAGLIRKLGAGLYTWLPLGLRVLKKIETIIRQEMDAIGAQEVLMPMVQPASLWQETQRWEQFGPLLLKIKDANQREFCLGPTHEEVITDLLRGELQSYKQLPICLYQIQTKFRDEIRPRFGVMRAREFLMKDAYSFHLNFESLQETYEKMYQAYTRIFTRLGLQFRAVLADTGSIGGSQSHEFHVLAETGEDCIVFSNSSQYAANIELAEAINLPVTQPTPANTNYQIVTTPGIKSIAGQAKHLHILEENILKTLLVKGCNPAHPVVALLLRGHHEVNPVKAEKHPLIASPLTFISPEEVETLAGCEPGFVGPIGLNVPLIADRAVAHMHHFMCGANQTDTHYLGVYWDRDCQLTEIADLRKVLPHDPSPDGKGQLEFARGIEVGHIFQLGDKYSHAMKMDILNEHGKPITPYMGCYGIGVSRLVAASIEQHHDEEGITWPMALAPFQVVLIPIGWQKSSILQEATKTLYNRLLEANIEVLFEDRDLRPGVVFRDMDLIGIPHRLVLSEKHLSDGVIEYKCRLEKTSKLIDQKDIVSFIKEKIHLSLC